MYEIQEIVCLDLLLIWSKISPTFQQYYVQGAILQLLDVLLYNLLSV
jgi:hypothetical protein